MTTKEKERSPSAELEALESERVKAAKEAKEIGREHADKFRQIRALTDERQRLRNREPGLTDHLGQPLDSIKNNPVRDVDKAIGDLGDLGDLAARLEHSRQLERHARERFEEHVREHGAAIDEARVAEGEALQTAYRETAAGLAEIAEQLVGYGQRTMELAHIRRLDTRRVPLDGVAAAARNARAMAETPPALPVVPHG